MRSIPVVPVVVTFSLSVAACAKAPLVAEDPAWYEQGEQEQAIAESEWLSADGRYFVEPNSAGDEYSYDDYDLLGYFDDAPYADTEEYAAVNAYDQPPLDALVGHDETSGFVTSVPQRDPDYPAEVRDQFLGDCIQDDGAEDQELVDTCHCVLEYMEEEYAVDVPVGDEWMDATVLRCMSEYIP